MPERSSQDYQLVEEVTTDGDIKLKLFFNSVTGLRVVSAYVDFPIVKGDLVFATEAFDDDGLPHTLEHLVFMGSENYPYKGILDMLANRCLASGTNAHTDTDHTNYTLCTAGSEGCLKLLPIYLDHLLFPTLTDAAYTTEVHHINGKGEDAGVVYCEMQATENSGDTKMYHEMLRAMYPGKCGYKSETGGLMANLRSSTNNEKVRAYHKHFYSAKNLCIIITGPVEPKDIFEAIKPIEDKIVAKNMHTIQFQRPWQTPVEPLMNSVQKTIEYPSDTDDDGLVYIAYRGPDVTKNFKELLALSVLLDYLNSTAVSPIQQAFVECPEPFCSSVSHNIIENSTSIFYLSFESVGKEYLDRVAEKLVKLLNEIVSNPDEFDVDRMQCILSRKIVRILSVAESSPHALVTGPVIGHFLYGSDQIKQRCQEIPILKEFTLYPKSYWLDLVTKYMIGEEARHACIVGYPSPTKMKQMADEETERLRKQREKLEKTLPAMAERLNLDIKSNEEPPPMAMLNSISTPSPDSIKLHQIERYILPDNILPFRFQYDSIKTNFITIYVLMDTSSCLTKQQRLYLPLLTEIIFESSIIRDGLEIPYEKVVADLFADTIAYSSSVGLSSYSPYSVGMFSMLFGLSMQVELHKYERGVEWLSEILYNTKFTKERIKTVASRMTSDITQYKRSGGKVASAAINALIYGSDCNQWAVNFVRQQKFLKQLVKELSTDPNTVMTNLTKVRDSMTKTSNIAVHIAHNKSHLNQEMLVKPWKTFSPRPDTSTLDFGDITPCHKLVQFVKKPEAAILGVGSIESNYMHILVKSINSPLHEDLPAVYVLIQYLTQLEGPMWRQIRGLGLSYHYSIQLSPSEGILSFLLYKSTQLVSAYNESKKIVCRLINGEDEFEDSLLDPAKSSLIFELIKREKSPAGKSIQSLIAYIRNTDVDYTKNLIKNVAGVTKDDLRRVAPIYLMPLFCDKQDKRSVICCNPSKVDDVVAALREVDFNFEKVDMDRDEFLVATD